MRRERSSTCGRAADELNATPRKRFGVATPTEQLLEQLLH